MRSFSSKSIERDILKVRRQKSAGHKLKSRQSRKTYNQLATQMSGSSQAEDYLNYQEYFDYQNEEEVGLDSSSSINEAEVDLAFLLNKEKLVRSRLLLAILSFWALLLVHRLVNLQILDVKRWDNWAVRQHNSEFKIAAQRGPMLDRHGKLLAVSVPAGSVYVRPKLVKDAHASSVELAKVLDLDPDHVFNLMTANKSFVWIKRQIPKVKAEQVANLHLAGVDYLMESKRFYPFNKAASRLIGKVGIDGVGLSGLEAAYESELHEDQYSAAVIRDAVGNILQIESNHGEIPLPQGHGVSLTIDAEIQQIMDEVLQKTHIESKAKQVMAVMVDAKTGAILGLSQTPLLNFNSQKTISGKALMNQILQAVYEPGSTIKPIVMAAALENDLVDIDEEFKCAAGTVKIGRKVIRDVHSYPILDPKGIIIRSSNIGMSQIGLRFGKKRLYDSLRTFGFGEKISLGLPGASPGILRNWKTWAEVDMATHAFGQGVAVTPLQMLGALSAIVNGGILPKLHVRSDSSLDVSGQRILRPEVAEQVKDMLVAVVEDAHGTGKQAQIPGVIIGGKTGTAQKAGEHGGYKAKSYIASFLGFADTKSVGLEEQLGLYVIVDEPNNGKIYGGVLAAPAFQEIIERTLRLLQARKVFGS